MKDLHHNTNKKVSVWRIRTKLEKRLFLSHAILIIVFILFGVAFCIDRFAKSDNSQICQKPECIHTASILLNSIDFSVDPCDNFYAFSCNKWQKDHPILSGSSGTSQLAQLALRNQLILKHVLEQPETPFDSNAEKKAKYVYNSCMDKGEIMEKLGAQPLINLIRQIGGWNISDSNYNLSNWTLERTLQIVHNKYVMRGLFIWTVSDDDRNSSRHIIEIDQGGLSLPTRDYYLNKTAHEKVYAAYLDYMIKVAVLLGTNEADVKPQMEAIIEFETRLAEITVPEIDRLDLELLYNKMTIKDLQTLAPFINWRKYFADAFHTINREITENEEIIVRDPKYLENLTKIIQEHLETNKGKIILNNYLIWRTIAPFTDYLSEEFRDAFKEVQKSLSGSALKKKDWRFCVEETDKFIGFAAGALFVRQIFNNKTKPETKKMINEIRFAFQKNLPKLKWMDAETRKLAKEKSNAISDMISFPDYILSPKLLDEKYKDLNIEPEKYFENIIQILIFHLKENLAILDEPVNKKTDWQITPSTVNAYYSFTNNQIVFPVGILQLPIYGFNNPKSLNFGSIGTIMGHELTHAFDNQGREYDKYGNLHQWWNNKTIEKFNEQINCLVEQYSKYSINNKTLNGKLTLTENIADNGGIKAAFNAFIKSKNETEADMFQLPGLNMTHRQLFFISFAQVWCSSTTAESTNLQIDIDSHTPSEFRVIGSLSNLPEFSEEFNCPIGSKMNPINKCEVW